MEDNRNFPSEKELDKKEDRQTINNEIEPDDCGSDMSIFDLADYSDSHNGLTEKGE